jgi:hypothetical protein
MTLTVDQLQFILRGIVLSSVKYRKRYQRNAIISGK